MKGKNQPKEDAEFKSNAGEYFNINMELAISLVFQKSKPLREKIDKEGITNQFLKQNIYNSQHFILTYNSLLQKLMNKKLLNPDLKTVKPKVMKKLETFVMERIDRCNEFINAQK